MPGFSDHNYSVRTLSDHTYAKAVPHIGTATRTDKDGTAVSDTMKNTSEAVLFFDKLFDSVNGWGSIKKKKGSGCGFIGRNLVEYLVSEGLASEVRVVDKTPPQTAWLNERHAQIFDNNIVDFRSANLINPASCAAALESDAPWDVVVNCAGETRCGQTEPVYSEGILTLSRNVAAECARARVGRLVELSSGCVYTGDKAAHKEEGPLEPWSVEGRWKLKVEEELEALRPQLKYTVLRPALVYGVADRRSLVPRLLVGGCYKYLGETMKLLWTAELRLNTVHVSDVCRAIWLVAAAPQAEGRTYNVVDEADSTQGSVTEIIAEIYNIKHDYVGTALSMVAKTDISGIAEEANDKHLSAWALACAEAGVVNTPLEPSTRPEMLLNQHLRLDGGALAELGFKCTVPAPTLRNVREVLDDYVTMKVFPKSLLQ